MKITYLLLAITGAIIPYIFFIDFVAAEGPGLSNFLAALFVNGAAGGATADLLVSSAVFWIYLFATGTPRAWIYILLNLVIGLSCALPAWLYAKELARERQGALSSA